MRKILIHLGDHTSDEAQPLTLFLARMTVDRNGTPKPKSLRQLPTSLKQLTITNVATNNQQTIAKPDSATFMLLPLGIRQKIFDILFGEPRKEAGFSTSLTCSGSDFTCVDCSQSSGIACDVHAHELQICIPQDIEQPLSQFSGISTLCQCSLEPQASIPPTLSCTDCSRQHRICPCLRPSFEECSQSPIP